MGFFDFKEEDVKYNASFGKKGEAFGILQGFTVTLVGFPKNTKIPTKGLTAKLHTDNLGTYISGKRVAAGAVLFGPIGALAGLIARKNTSAVYVTLEKDGEVVGILSDKAKKIAQARKFIEVLQKSATDPKNT